MAVRVENAQGRTLHGGDIAGLDVVLEVGDFLLELVQRNLLVLDDQVDLQHSDTVTDGDELGSTPN